jgi:hypothetical protein
MTFADELGEVRTKYSQLGAEIAGFRTLEHILDWMKREGHSFESLDMVTQDEFCHDLLLPIGPDWLVFGVT